VLGKVNAFPSFLCSLLIFATICYCIRVVYDKIMNNLCCKICIDSILLL